MKRTKGKIAGLLCTAFVLTFMVVFSVFHVLMNRYIQNGAAEAIRQYTNVTWTNSWEYRFSPYFAAGLYLERDENSYYQSTYSDEPQMPYKDSLIEWVSRNEVATGEITAAKIAGRNYYISIQPIADDPDFLLAAYVDVTAEKHLVTRIGIAMLLIMILCSVGACLVGVCLGKIIEQEQWKQKKLFENASHQLKTPLTVIQGYADGLSCGVVKDQKQAADIIMEETEKMAFLIDEILSLSRMESEETVFSFDPVPLEPLLNNCLTSIEFLAEKKGIRIEADLSDSVVRADAVQLERAIINVLSNAVRYAKTTIWMRCTPNSIVIRDDGEGVSDEDLKNIFKRFYTGKNGNTGIGLALTREVILRHGWEIHAKNVGNGLQFTIKIK